MRRLAARLRARLATRIDWSSDAGFAAGGEAIAFGVLIFVVGTLMVTNLWGVIDTKMATNGAAREGARLVAEADGPGTDPHQLGIDAAKASLQAHGRDAAVLTYGVTYHNTGDVWAPCARAEVTVAYPLKLISLPFVNVGIGNDFRVASTHSEIVDPYRSRPTDPGEIAC